MKTPSEPSRRRRKRSRRNVGRTGARFPSAHLQDRREEGAETPEAEQPAEQDADGADEPQAGPIEAAEPPAEATVVAGPDPELSVDGSELGAARAVIAEPAATLAKDAEAGAEEVDAAAPGPDADGPPDADDTDGQAGVDQADDADASLPNALLDPAPDGDGRHDAERHDAELDELDDARSWVRPYVWTGGRTDTTLEFALETLVSARKAAEESGVEEMRDEHRRVLELCDQPRSVTEIASLLSVPLGVAKTLLGAMAEEDMLVVHSNGESGSVGPDLALMERVLQGLRNL
ncbi:MAG: DUF742 domain-containing protein [Haloechinothrix sp.]